ncbi:putative amino-acid permease C15C4.04c [Exophiala dermatitidis]
MAQHEQHTPTITSPKKNHVTQHQWDLSSGDVFSSVDAVAVMETKELSDEDRRLAELGYAQVYKREFSMWSTFSFALSISGLFASVTTTYSYPLYAGGAASAVWCWLISGFGAMCIALSVAEIVSAYPTSGGLYFTCKYLAPAKWMAQISWLCGWLNILGQIAGTASANYGCAQLLLAAVSMGSDFTYFPTAGHTVGVSAALGFIQGAINSLSTKWLERITKSYLLVHVGILVSACITLLVMQKDKHSSSYVWTHVESRSGWTPVGWSFLFGFLSVSWTMTDYDATAHIAEEIKNPEIKAPWAISTALGATYVGGWLFTIVLAYCMGDLEDILNSPVGQPVAQIFYNCTGKAGGIFFTVAAFLVANFCILAGIQAGSRTVWALSRDEMLPFSRVWYRINKTSQTPLNALALFCTCAVLINLIALGSSVTVAAIFNVTAIAYDWSYCIPILLKLRYGQFERGPWHLGRASTMINIWSCVWTAFVSVLFLMPTAMPVEPNTFTPQMNYASVILVAIFVFSTAYWYIAGRKFYHGPRVNARLIDGVSPDQDSEGHLKEALKQS